jgi:hypothetical protein
VPVFISQLFTVWFHQPNLAAFGIWTNLAIGLVINTAAVALFALRRGSQEPLSLTRTLLGTLIAGLLILIFGQATQIISMKPPESIGWLSRWNQISMLGAVMIWTSGIMLLSRKLLRERGDRVATVLLAIMVTGGSIVHVQIANNYANYWKDFRSIWWQMAEFSPDIASNSTILLDVPALNVMNTPIIQPFGYEPLVAAELFFNNSEIAVTYYYALNLNDHGDKLTDFAFDNDTWSIRWRFNPENQVLVRMIDGCLQVVDPAYLERYDLRPRVQRLASPLAPDPQQFFVDVLEGKTFPYRHLFGSPMSAEGCPSPFAIPGD